MGNPFFESSRFLRERPEGKALQDVLSDSIKDGGVIRNYYEMAGHMPGLTMPQAPSGLWREALDNMALHGALKVFCEAMETLKSPAILKAVRGVLQAQPLREHRILPGNTLMLDRATLRVSLAELQKSGYPAKVLLVRGGPATGKSHCRYLFEHTARDCGATPVYLKAGMVATVDEVVLALFGVFRATDKIPPRLTTPDAWHKLICIKLLELASNLNKPVWLAIDNLGSDENDVPLLDREIKQFCDQFALQLENPSLGDWFRLMLIHYPDGNKPTHWGDELCLEERCGDTDIGLADVEALLLEWADAEGKRIPADDIPALAQGVMAKAEQVPPGVDPPGRLRRLHHTLKATLRDLATQRGAA